VVTVFLRCISEDDANDYQMIKVGLAIDMTHLQLIGS
jgi:hypothetical protein